MSAKNRIDRIDLAILNILQKEARITNQRLAEAVGLSPSSCLMRVKRLEENGHIGPYYGVINLDNLCRNIICIATVTIQNQTKDDFLLFEQQVRRIPEITECYTVSGAFDFIMKIVCPDMKHYLRLTNDLIDATTPSVNINTHVVMNENKQFSGFPLDKLM